MPGMGAGPGAPGMTRNIAKGGYPSQQMNQPQKGGQPAKDEFGMALGPSDILRPAVPQMPTTQVANTAQAAVPPNVGKV
jgi:hypothetical protein